MEYPEFFNEVEPFILKDDLAEFLGATKDGIIEINYIDCVKLAGHSCPTVAGGYIIAKVAIEKSKEHQVIGVIGLVLSFIFGSNDSGGFSGIGGKFNRRNLLHYGVSDVNGMVKMTNLDSGETITLTLDTSVVPGKEEQEEFRKLWQERVKYMLINNNIWNQIAKG